MPKDPFSSFSHLLGALLAIPGLAWLLVASNGDPWRTVGFAIYGTSLILLYTASTLYHWLPVSPRAMVQKVHHCMADGMSALNVLAALFSPDPKAPAREPSPWRPRPAPGATGLFLGELRRRARAPLALASVAARALANPGQAFEEIRETAAGIVEAVAEKLQPASPTPLNLEEVGPHRRFDWLRTDLAEMKEVKHRLGGKLNDVVLAIVTGAIRRYLEAHATPADGLDFRVVMPINTRTMENAAEFGNRVVPTLVRLPLAIRDPRARIRAIAETTEAIKASRQVHAIEFFEDVANWADAALLSELMRRATRWWSGNLIVTNVPGPQVPLHFLGSRLVECYPYVPMMANQALCVALLSYAGGLYWGFNADRDAISDLHDLVGCFADEAADLARAAGVRKPATPRKKPHAPLRATRRPRPAGHVTPR